MYHSNLFMATSIPWANIAIYVAIIIILIIFSAFFSETETVFSCVNKAKLMTLIEENKKGARKALWLNENYDKALAVILLGNNLVNILISTLGLRVLLLFFNYDAPAYVDAINTIIITIVVLLFGEVLPKTKGRSNPEKYALRYSGILYVVVKVLYPLALPFYKLNQVRKVNIEETSDTSLSSDDLENLIDAMEDKGKIEEQEADMLQHVLDLREVDVKNIMTPRVDTVCLNIDSTIEEVKECFFKNQYSRIPVYEGTIDHIVGILFEKEFFKAYVQNPKLDSIKGLLQDPLFVVGSMSADKLLSLLKKKNVHLAVVLDEYAGFDGVVTMEDALEEVVGEIYDEHDEVPFTVKDLGDNKYLVSGDYELVNLYEYFEFEEDVDDESYTTVGGMVQEKLERLPLVGDKVSLKIRSQVIFDELSSDEGIEYKVLLFTVKEIVNNRIKTLELKIIDYVDHE